MALTDPSTQLQLVGIRTLAVLGAQPGTLKRKRKERVLVLPCDFLSSKKSSINSLVLTATLGDLGFLFFFLRFHLKERACISGGRAERQADILLSGELDNAGLNPRTLR